MPFLDDKIKFMDSHLAFPFERGGLSGVLRADSFPCNENEIAIKKKFKV